MLEFNKEHISADLSQVKSKIDNAKKVGKIMLAGVAISSTLLLSGCGNYTILDTKYTYNKAIAIINKGTKDKDWYSVNDKNCFKTWNEVDAFIDGICKGKNTNFCDEEER